MARIWAGLAAAGLFLLAVLGIYSKGRSDARASADKERLEDRVDQQAEVIEQVQEAHQVRQEVEQKVDTTPPSKNRQDLIDRWGEP